MGYFELWSYSLQDWLLELGGLWDIYICNIYICNIYMLYRTINSSRPFLIQSSMYWTHLSTKYYFVRYLGMILTPCHPWDGFIGWKTKLCQGFDCHIIKNSRTWGLKLAELWWNHQ
jgi:hypothetical protein